MATFTCWCGYMIREYEGMPDAGHIVWDCTKGFYEDLADALSRYLTAVKDGHSVNWRHEFFGQRYPDDLPAVEVIQDITSAVTMKYCTGIYRCPQCGRLHVQREHGVNRWESYIPEGKSSGDSATALPVICTPPELIEEHKND